MDMAAVGALPDGISILGENQPFLHIRQQLAVPLLMLLFDLANRLKQISDMVEAFFLGLLGKLSVHFRPFVVFAHGGIQQIGIGIADAVVQTALKQLTVCALITANTPFRKAMR